VNWLREC